jgi:hypothetical protein
MKTRKKVQFVCKMYSAVKAVWIRERSEIFRLSTTFKIKFLLELVILYFVSRLEYTNFRRSVTVKSRSRIEMTPKIYRRKICMTNITLKLYVFISALSCISAVHRLLRNIYRATWKKTATTDHLQKQTCFLKLIYISLLFLSFFLLCTPDP